MEVFEAMNLKEQKFLTMQRLVHFVNDKKLEPELISAIVPIVRGGETVEFSLSYWFKEGELLPLMESESTSLDRDATGLPKPEKEILMPVTPEELADINITYTKAQQVTDHSEVSPQEIVDYLKQKDREREKYEDLKKASEEIIDRDD